MYNICSSNNCYQWLTPMLNVTPTLTLTLTLKDNLPHNTYQIYAPENEICNPHLKNTQMTLEYQIHLLWLYEKALE